MTPLEAALDYAGRGWRVVPIIPGTKRPSLTKWTEAATSDPTTITSWWGQDYPGHGVGIATGPHSGIWVLDVDDTDAFLDLEQRHQQLPSTMTSLTGSGGLHLIFRWPTDGRDIRNDAGRRLGPGLDVRGDGGQIVAPPTIHPNGIEYAWDVGEAGEPVDAPEWLLDLVTAPETVAGVEDRIRLAQSDRPGDLWAAATSWEDILTADGWTLCWVDRTGEQYWARPGKEPRQGASATTGYAGSDSLKVFTSSMRHVGLVEEEAYTKLGYLAATRYGGDHAAAATWLASQGFTTMAREDIALAAQGEAPADVAQVVADTVAALPEPVETAEDAIGWHRVDLAGILDGSYQPPTPTLLARNDGLCLIYPGRVHSIAGEPGGGKTWIALHLIAQTLADGGTAMLIDYEDRPDAAVSRLIKLGVDRQVILDRFYYVDPDGPLLDKQGRVNAPAITMLEALAPDVCIIDSIGESIAVEGLNPNDDREVADWFRILPRFMAKLGTAVVGLDHVTKSSENRGLWAIGSQRKLAAIDGAAYALDVIFAPTKTSDGLVHLSCAKDRHGTFQRGRRVAEARIVNVGLGEVRVALEAPETVIEHTEYQRRVMDFLDIEGACAGREVEQRVTGKAEHIRQALRELEANQNIMHVKGEGWVIRKRLDPGTGGGGGGISLPNGSDQEDTSVGDAGSRSASPPQDTSQNDRVPRVPPASPCNSGARPLGGDAPASERVPASPPLEGGDAGDAPGAPSLEGDDWLL